MDTGLNENQSELRVFVLSVSLKVLADSDSLQRVSMRLVSYGIEVLTFLINMYRSSGISGARPIKLVSQWFGRGSIVHFVFHSVSQRPSRGII